MREYIDVSVWESRIELDAKTCRAKPSIGISRKKCWEYSKLNWNVEKLAMRVAVSAVR